MTTRGGATRCAWAVLGLVWVISGCARAAATAPNPPSEAHAIDAELASPPEVWDPMERVNRRTLDVNIGINRWFIDPITRAYAFVVPEPGRQAVRRFLINLETPSVLANDILQLAPIDAAVTVTRFAVNSTAGLAGLFDPAEKMGLDGHHTDFGQTLALYGVPSGPYIVLPVLGPTTVRDGSGYVVDFLFQPTTYVLPGLTLFIYASIHQGSAGLATFEAHAHQLHALEASSVDFYAALRSAYYQDRTAAIAARSDRGPRAVAERLRAFSLGSSGSKVGDLPAHHPGQRRETVALQD